MEVARFDLLVLENYEYGGRKRFKSHKVGTARPSKDGYMLFIPPGVSISGRVMMVPEKTALNEIDLIEAYQSAADEHGL